MESSFRDHLATVDESGRRKWVFAQRPKGKWYRRRTVISGVFFALFFALHLSGFFGLRINDNYSEKNNILDLQEGNFTDEKPDHLYYLDQKESKITSEILKIMQPAELEQIHLHHEFRRNLLFAYERYYALHIQEFGTIRSLPILSEILR